MSINEVTAKLDVVIDQIDAGIATASRALIDWGEALSAAAKATAGSSRPEAVHAQNLLTHARQSLASVIEMAQSAGTSTQLYRTHLAGDGSSSPAAAVPPPIIDEVIHSNGPVVERSAPTSEKIAALVRDLPPPVVPHSGQKTHGRWFGEDGEVHSELSGKDEKYRQAVQVFEKDMRSRRIPSTVVDVEIKLAAHMRANRIRSATLVINNQPCRGPMGCDALVPVVLPPGYTLTVIGPDGFRREYKGGVTSKWVP